MLAASRGGVSRGGVPRGRGLRGRVHGAGEAARRDADDAAEMPTELALVVKPEGGRRLGAREARREQGPGPCDAQVRQVVIGGKPHLGAEGANEMKLVGAGLGGERV